MSKKRIVVIGAGHNGLVCAYYLAKAGHKVTIIERNIVVGGAAVTTEICPGFRNSAASYTVGLLPKKIIDDMNLESHGLNIIPRPMNNFIPLANDYFRFGGSVDVKEEISRFSRSDADNYDDFMAMLNRVASIFRKFMWDTPPTTKGLTSIFGMLQASGRLYTLTEEEQREIIDLFFKSAYDVVSRYFQSEPLKALLCWDSVVGNYASPYDNGTGYVLLHHVFGESTHGWGHAIGGMGSITQAMQRACEKVGVDIITGFSVDQIITKRNRVHSVWYGCGTYPPEGKEILVDAVVSNVHPQILYKKLLSPSVLGPDFLTRIDSYKSGSATLRINVALNDLPRFECLPEDGEHYGAGILFIPSVKYMDDAYLDARKNGYSSEPIVEMLIPSVIDPTLAPKGKHVASLFCQHFDPDYEWTDENTLRATYKVFSLVERYMPGFINLIIDFKSMSPKDLDRIFGLVKGDIFHGQLSFDQMYMNRPILGYGNYRGPVEGLYMCGSGTHPGGGVNGIPGHNAAREILKDI